MLIPFLVICQVSENRKHALLLKENTPPQSPIHRNYSRINYREMSRKDKSIETEIRLLSGAEERLQIGTGDLLGMMDIF